MPLPECHQNKTPSPTEEEQKTRQKFLSLVEGMNLPKHRVLNYDFEWILMHGLEKNVGHSNFSELGSFLNEILDWR